MKISDDMRFAHPVLSGATADFPAGSFNFTFDDVEERTSDGRLRLSYSCEVTEDDVRGLVHGDTARIGLFVFCGETYFNQLRRLSLGKDVLEFQGGLLNGRVVLRPVIWIERALDHWRPNVHAEFGTEPIFIGQHKLLGIGEEFIINVGRDKLRPLETIFTLAVSNEMPEGQIGIDLEAERIRIIVDKNTHASINLYRGNDIGRAILLNGVYLPAVMEILRNLASEKLLYEQYRWYRPFTAKCEHLSINLDDPSLLQDAQKLLLKPYRRLMDRQEKLMP